VKTDWGRNTVFRTHISRIATYIFLAFAVFLPGFTIAKADSHFSDYPLCKNHNASSWHSLIDSDNGCHYDHEHKHDPEQVDEVFGKVGEWAGFQDSISYPWHTPNENEMKHEMYGWVVRTDIPRHGEGIYIKDFRLQYHATSANPDILTRYHSYSLEAQICNQQGDCGVVRTGGWVDFGALNVKVYEDGEYYECLIAEDPQTCTDSSRRKIHYRLKLDPNVLTNETKAEFFWYGSAFPMTGYKGPLRTQIALATADSWINVDPQDPSKNEFFCPNFDCEKNGSTIQAHVVSIRIPEKDREIDFDPDNGGFSTYSGYTDRFGRIVESCESVSLDCIPVELENVPQGQAQHRDDKHLDLSTAGMTDFDISPEGEYWIKFPN
jgi:hypothetical protein